MGDGIAECLELLVGGFEFQFGFLQRRLSLLSICDVSGNPECADDLAGLIREWNLCRRDPGLLAVRPNDALFFINQRLARSYDLLFFLKRLLGMWKKVKIRLAHDFGGVVQPKRFGLGSTVPYKTALSIFKVNLVRHMIKHHMEQVVRL